MLHPAKKNVLLCDYCGAEMPFVSERLQYYSINFKKVETIMNAKINKTDVDDSLDLDICLKCYDEIFARVKEINIKNNELVKSKK